MISDGKTPRLDDDGDLELSTLRKQVVAQARELGVLRWEFSALARRHPVSGAVTQVKSSLLRRFPKQVGQIHQMRQAMRQAFGALATRPRSRSSGMTIVGAGASHVLRVVRAPILIIGDGPVGRQIARSFSWESVVRIESGAGLSKSFKVPLAGEPPLRTPVEGSFVKWLIDGADRLKKFGTIVVDAADDLSIGLLRGRLDRTQMVVFDTTTESSLFSPLLAELQHPYAQDSAYLAYSKLPAVWLDPLNGDGSPDASVVGERSWPKVSVVMVSFNQAEFLEEGLNSVLGQGYPNLETIVVDGNSTDGSLEILKRYRDRLTQLVIEPDDGQADGLNKGFARATGDILTWVNSDDLLEPGALFRIAQAFATPGVDMVAGGCRQIGMSRDKIILNHHNSLPFGIPIALPLGLLLEMERFWLAGSFFYQPEVFFSKEIWKRSGGKLRTDLYYILDYDLWVRMSAAGAHIVHIPDFLACSRTHDRQKTTVAMPYMPEVQRLLQEYSSRLLAPP